MPHFLVLKWSGNGLKNQQQSGGQGLNVGKPYSVADPEGFFGGLKEPPSTKQFKAVSLQAQFASCGLDNRKRLLGKDCFADI